MEKRSSNKKVQTAWAMFDWANSAYSLVIVSAIFPQVFTVFAEDNPVFFGIDFKNAETLYTVSICFSFLFIAIITPLLSGMSDYSGKKKRYMQFFTLLGSLSCMFLYYFSEETLWIGVVGAILASIGYSGSMVFYNSYLPDVATSVEQDALSAKGYSLGYIGSSLLLITILVMVANFEGLGFDSKLSVFRWGFVIVGLWWLLWAQWTFAFLPKGKKAKNTAESLIKMGFKELKGVWLELKNQKVLKQFLKAFFVVDLGLQTLIIVAPLFAKNVVGMKGEELIVVVLIMQFLGVAGAVLFSKLSSKKGNVLTLVIATALYLLICLLATLFVDKGVFYVLAGLMGLALGGLQSQARSSYSKLLPEGKPTVSYFSFYDVLEKVAIVIGTLLYAGISYFLSDQTVLAAPKIGILTLGVFFMLGLILWLPLRKESKLK